ncbi:MAG: signal recognition particle-docking protein FtsY, partial [Gemmatimonadota bacterium]|nr:signal recognition particle-docking protein FtsY [Gemmatimonadota bacterium]
MKRGLWQKLKAVALTDVGVLVRGLDRDSLERVERVLLEADFGPASFALVERLEEVMRRGTLKTEAALRAWLIAEIAAQVRDAGVADTLRMAAAGEGPTVMLVLGVNGVGKTTQTAKLAHRLQRDGRRVLLAAADTYRAGAVEQLAVWADRLGVPCVTGQQG